ncbi:hypothetical protein Pelo_826 [Pelomyxa schiedti]|nr:hypothetical protein Pelo_826 [Pelomyxa schiedti]
MVGKKGIDRDGNQRVILLASETLIDLFSRLADDLLDEKMPAERDLANKDRAIYVYPDIWRNTANIILSILHQNLTRMFLPVPRDILTGTAKNQLSACSTPHTRCPYSACISATLRGSQWQCLEDCFGFLISIGVPSGSTHESVVVQSRRFNSREQWSEYRADLFPTGVPNTVPADFSHFLLLLALGGTHYSLHLQLCSLHLEWGVENFWSTTGFIPANERVTVPPLTPHASAFLQNIHQVQSHDLRSFAKHDVVVLFDGSIADFYRLHHKAQVKPLVLILLSIIMLPPSLQNPGNNTQKAQNYSQIEVELNPINFSSTIALRFICCDSYLSYTPSTVEFSIQFTDERLVSIAKKYSRSTISSTHVCPLSEGTGGKKKSIVTYSPGSPHPSIDSATSTFGIRHESSCNEGSPVLFYFHTELEHSTLVWMFDRSLAAIYFHLFSGSISSNAFSFPWHICFMKRGSTGVA